MEKLPLTEKKFDRFDSRGEAVSPVVGVMLMLAVTLIVAAIVSGFVGGLPDTRDKASNVAIKATYSQKEGLTITHMGGDPVPTIDTVVMVRLSKTFGDVEYMSWVVDPLNIVSKRGDNAEKIPWLTKTGSAGEVSFVAGDNAYVEPDKDEKYANAGKYLQNGLKPSNKYSVDNPSNIGKEFWVVLNDKSGVTFAKTRVVITK